MPSPLTIPKRMTALPRDKHGRLVPWFVAWIDGQPDHRVADTDKFVEAVRFNACWLCGQPLGTYRAFVIGPMCAVNRITAEPPSHRDCATYAARACPFLITPAMVRRARHLPEERSSPAGEMLLRNPGVALVWVTRSHTVQRWQDGLLFSIGDPEETRWYAEGRPATRAEVDASIASGLPLLRDVAEAQGAHAVDELERGHAAALALLPNV